MDLFDQRHSGGVIFVGLAGEAHDEIRGQDDIGARGLDALDQAKIFLGGVLAVHRLENAVRARLHRQMQIGHQLGLVAMSLDQIVGHVVGMAGGIADAVEPVDFGQSADQPAQLPIPAIRTSTMPAVDVLAQKRDVAHPARNQIAGFGQDTVDRTADLRPAGIGHNAEGAKLVAAFLNRQESGRRTTGRGGFRQMLELVLGGKLGIDPAPLAHHFRQAVIGLRAHDQIDQRHAALDLGTLGLCDAARNADLEIGTLGFQRLEAAKVGIQLFRGFLADVAGVEKHHIRIFGGLGQHIALRAHRFGHALAVIDVHLAAIGLDEELFGPFNRLFALRCLGHVAISPESSACDTGWRRNWKALRERHAQI